MKLGDLLKLAREERSVAAEYKDPPGTHRHKCYACGIIWSHGDENFFSPEAHLCPSCGQKETYHYRGDGKPACEHPPRAT